MTSLVDELLGHIGVDVGYEAEAAALPADWVPNYLGILHGAILLEVLHEGLIGESVIEPPDEDFVAHALQKLLLGILTSEATAAGSLPGGPIARPASLAPLTLLLAVADLTASAPSSGPAAGRRPVPIPPPSSVGAPSAVITTSDHGRHP